MLINSKSMLIAIMIGTIILVPFGYSADPEEQLGESSSFDYFIDIIAWRPLGVCATVLGAGLFVVTLPFSLPTKTVEKTQKKLVEVPFHFTFRRPWGVLD